jgi:hypothetical protein
VGRFRLKDSVGESPTETTESVVLPFSASPDCSVAFDGKAVILG